MKNLYIPNPYPPVDSKTITKITPTKVVIPITDMQLSVEMGEYVVKGQIIATGSEYAHASISGKVTGIAPHLFPHPSGLTTRCITIEDSDDNHDTTEITYNSFENITEVSATLLQEHLNSSGIIGLGGAGYNMHSKLTGFIEHHQDTSDTTLLINATECEPVAQADYALILAYTHEILAGAQILCYIANIPRVIIAIEDNKPELYDALTRANTYEYMSVQLVPAFYASGAEKTLIKQTLGITIGPGEYAMEKGVLSYNVATVKAVYDYVRLGKPLTERIITITGDKEHPHNVLAPIGTPIAQLISKTKISGYIRTNGMMMGIDIPDASVPIIKTTNVIIYNSTKPDNYVSECIKCSQCVPVCPEKLLPQQLYFFIKGENIPKAEFYYLADCILCRCCDEVCPSNIPLSEYFRLGQAKAREFKREQLFVQQSKKRSEFRQYRLERNKQEREVMMAKKREEAKRKLAAMNKQNEK